MDDFKVTRSFISQSEIDERRAQRQQEWEKARQEGKEVPPHPDEYDSRTLYERLLEQKQKKDDEYREATRFANLVPKLNDDEYDFLHRLDTHQQLLEKEKRQHEQVELERFRRDIQGKKSAAPKATLSAAPCGPAQPQPILARGVKRAHPLTKLDGLVRVTKKSQPSHSTSSSNLSHSTRVKSDDKSQAIPGQFPSSRGSVTSTTTTPSLKSPDQIIATPTTTTQGSKASPPTDLHQLLGDYGDSSDDSGADGSQKE